MTEDYYEVSFPEQDHIRLKNTLAGCQGKWMVSYNDCSYIRDLYAGYYLTEATRLNNMAQRYEKGSEYRELIITNYDPEEKRRSSGQMTLLPRNFWEVGDDKSGKTLPGTGTDRIAHRGQTAAGFRLGWYAGGKDRGFLHGRRLFCTDKKYADRDV